MKTLTKPFAIAALAVTTALPLSAQSVSDFSTIFGPQFVSYKFGTGATAQTVNQLSVPLVLLVPFSESFSLDISTAYANTKVSQNGVQQSAISGLTDTQVRGNYVFGDNSAVFTFGVNLPTGQYKVPNGQSAAAGSIGNNFIVYPISSMGSGLAGTLGIAVARTVGEWNVGVGVSGRHSQQFDAFAVSQTSVLRFTPGDEFRARVGIDRAIGDGHFAVGAIYSVFGNDKADSTSFATGQRVLGTASYTRPLGTSGDLTISGWDLFRGEGEQFAAKAKAENVLNGTLAVGQTFGDLYVQPSIEGRAWTRAGEQAGQLFTGGVRLRFDMLGMSANPAVTYSVGKYYPEGSTASVDVTGIRASLLLRFR